MTREMLEQTEMRALSPLSATMAHAALAAEHRQAPGNPGVSENNTITARR
jgi:hypothetical protein